MKETISSEGWARGADISESLGLYYVGVSEFCRRYSLLNLTVRQTPAMVRAISIETTAQVGELEFSGIEQVAKMHVIPKRLALAMLYLQPDLVSKRAVF